MVREELIRRSPVRILEKSIQGGVGVGNIGVIAARKGTGKTACLVHIATDQLLQGKHVIHVSFSSRTDHIMSWYEDIFREIARKRNLENAMDVHDDLIRNRVLMNFNQHGITIDQLLKSLRAMIVAGGFAANTIVIDGYDFETGDPESLRRLREFAHELKLTLWFSASTHRDRSEVDEHDVPMLLHPYLKHISVIISLTPEERHISLRLIKDHDRYSSEGLHLELDSGSLLIISK
jgi:hypothetical protein